MGGRVEKRPSLVMSRKYFISELASNLFSCQCTLIKTNEDMVVNCDHMSDAYLTQISSV